MSNVKIAAVVFAAILGVSAIVAISLDVGLGKYGPPERGAIQDKIYRAPYTTTRWVSGTKNRGGHFQTTYHPASYSLNSCSKSTCVHSFVTRDAFYRYSVGHLVTLQESFGRYTHWSYGWRLTAFSAPDFSVEKRKDRR